MEVMLKIFRYNPERDKKPSYKTYKLEAEETDRVLDLLEKVKGYQDGTSPSVAPVGMGTAVRMPCASTV